MMGAQFVRLALVVVALSLGVGASAQYSITWDGWADSGTNGGYWSAALAGCTADLAPTVLGVVTEAYYGGAVGTFTIAETCPGMETNILTTATGSMAWDETSLVTAPLVWALTETNQVATIAVGDENGASNYDTTGDCRHSTLQTQPGADPDSGTADWALGCVTRLSGNGRARLYLAAWCKVEANLGSRATVDECETTAATFRCTQ